MLISWFHRASSLIGAISLCALMSPAALAQTTYSVEELPMLPAGPGRNRFGVNAVDAQGRVLGFSIAQDVGIPHSQICTNGRCRMIAGAKGTKGALYKAFGPDGMTIGDQAVGSWFYGLIRRPGEGTERLLPGTLVAANAHGTIVGNNRSGHAAPNSPYRYEHGAYQFLTGLGGSQAYVQDINDAGVAVGFAYLPSGEGRAVRWEGITPIELGALQPGQRSEARAVNNAGVIVGCSAWGDMSPPWRYEAAKWVDGVLIPLGSIGGINLACATHITEDGVILGWSQVELGADATAFIMEGDAMVILQSRLSVADQEKYLVLSPAGIGPDGTIAANARRNADFASVALLLRPNR